MTRFTYDRLRETMPMRPHPARAQASACPTPLGSKLQLVHRLLARVQALACPVPPPSGGLPPAPKVRYLFAARQASTGTSSRTSAVESSNQATSACHHRAHPCRVPPKPVLAKADGAMTARQSATPPLHDPGPKPMTHDTMTHDVCMSPVQLLLHRSAFSIQHSAFAFLLLFLLVLLVLHSPIPQLLDDLSFYRTGNHF